MLLSRLQEDANCIITMTYVIKLVHDCSPFEALQLYIKRILVSVHETAQKYGKRGNFEVMVLVFFRIVAAVRNKCYLYSSSTYQRSYVHKSTLCRVARTRAGMYAKIQCVQYCTYCMHQINYTIVHYLSCQYQSGIYIKIWPYN